MLGFLSWVKTQNISAYHPCVIQHLSQIQIFAFIFETILQYFCLPIPEFWGFHKGSVLRVKFDRRRFVFERTGWTVKKSLSFPQKETLFLLKYLYHKMDCFPTKNHDLILYIILLNQINHKTWSLVPRIGTLTKMHCEHELLTLTFNFAHQWILSLIHP